MVLASALICSLSVTPVNAEPSAEVQDLQNEQADLEGQKSTAQSELGSLQAQLEGLLSKIAEIENDLAETGQEIVQAREDLKVAEDQREKQYESMKLRIRYIYESGGDTAALEKVLSSGTMSGLLTQAEYSQKVHEYDRAQLQEYAETVKKIQKLEDTLEAEMTDLQNLETDYQAQQNTLNTTIESKRDEISDLDGMIQAAARKVMEQQQSEQAQQAEAEEGAAQEQNGSNSGHAADNADTNTDNSDSTDNSNSAGGTDNAGGSGGNDSQEPESQPESKPESKPESQPESKPESQPESKPESKPQEPSYDTSVGGSVVSRAESALGKPYVWGAAGPDSFDCSGLVSFALTGRYSHTWSTSDIITWTRVSNPQPGDICIKVGHCGVYIGGGMMIHAPTEGDVVKVAPVQSGMFYVRY